MYFAKFTSTYLLAKSAKSKSRDTLVCHKQGEGFCEQIFYCGQAFQICILLTFLH